MKKQILTLAMCLALTATSALAESNNNAVTQKATTTTIKTVPNSNLVKPVEPHNLMSREEAKKHFEERKAKERNSLYQALKLSDEQKIKAEELDAKTRAEAGKYIRKVQIEAKKLRDLKNKNASFFAIRKQKSVLKSAKKEANKYFEDSRKAFEAILTKEQNESFKLIDEAKRKKIESFKKNHKQGRPEGMGPGGPMGPEPMGPPPGKK